MSSSPWTNLGVALVAQDRFEEATAAFEHADRLAGVAGEGFDQHLNLGMCLRESGRLDEALKLYELKLPTLPAVDVNTHYAHGHGFLNVRIDGCNRDGHRAGS